MPIFMVLVVVAGSCLVTPGSARAGTVTPVNSGPKVETPLPVIRDTRPSVPAFVEAPIVMGRSVGFERRTRLQHIKARPAGHTAEK
jgi:hypothetical protein